MNVAEAIVKILAETGVRHIFGLPGDTGMDFYDALYHCPEITHILTRDERSAAFMADAYARVSGRLGVCEGPSGGGATYIVPGVAEANGSSSPVLCLTSDTPIGEDGRGVLTELDQVSLFRPVTKYATRLATSEGAPDALRRAIRMATSGRPGAVSVVMPADVLAEGLDEAAAYGVPELLEAPAQRTRPDPALVERAAALIAGAERPVIVAGGGVRISGAWDELTWLAEAGNIPVGTSINGKGSVPETSPISLGVVGGNGARPYANDVVASADLVIFVGTRTDSVTTLDWTLPRRGGPKVVQIDVDPWQPGNNYRADVAIIGDAKLALADLLEALDRSDPKIAGRAAWLADIEARRDAYFAEESRKAESLSRPIKPQRVIAALRRLLDPETVIVADPGTPTPFISAQYPLERPGRWTVIPRAHGGLGYAIPAVVGAYFAAGGRRVVGLCGDGSFGMSAGELETIARLGLPIALIQFNNGSFGWIKELQHLYHGDRYYSVDFKSVDYAGIARGFGFEAAQVTDPAEVERALATALDAGRPYFVDIVSESPITETPPVAAWQAAEAGRALR
ncbi:MAG: thiamine pyrophosphate-binding protein [Thermomicrobiaceae bacterium]|nr:thiamine pyrophosphate-binding protein [Thermomicrobiaceae bacterium]